MVDDPRLPSYRPPPAERSRGAARSLHTYQGWRGATRLWLPRGAWQAGGRPSPKHSFIAPPPAELRPGGNGCHHYGRSCIGGRSALRGQWKETSDRDRPKSGHQLARLTGECRRPGTNQASRETGPKFEWKQPNRRAVTSLNGGSERFLRESIGGRGALIVSSARSGWSQLSECRTHLSRFTGKFLYIWSEVPGSDSLPAMAVQSMRRAPSSLSSIFLYGTGAGSLLLAVASTSRRFSALTAWFV